MTFKNIGFSDSPVMRSLEKVAINKGLVKVQEIKKSASKELDVKITDNLMSNLLKLCTALKSKGLNNYAQELEFKIISYKKAATNKDYSPILNEAHPKGSHKLENLDHVINTLLDNELAILQSVSKQPKGKLANKKILSKVAQVLSTDNKIENKLEFQDTPWVSEDGLRCNSKFITVRLESQALALNETIKKLSMLKSLSSDSRFAPEVGKAVVAAMNIILNLLKDYVTACKTASTKARELETARLKNSNDLNQARVSFSEVGANFKNGVLSKVNIGKASNFLEIENSIISLKKDLGNLLYEKLSPGFDFDEDFMKSIKDQGLGYLNEIKTVLGS